MPDHETEIERLDVQLEGLESNLAATVTMTSAFQRELSTMQTSLSGAGRETANLTRSLSSDMRSAFSDLVFGGAKVSDVFRDLAQSMIKTTFNNALKPVTNAVSGALTKGIGGIFSGLLPFEKGGVFSAGHVMPFAKGGIVSSPTTFPMRGGNTGLMGEAGPEAIMPLARGADGSLGVRGAGGNAVTVNMMVQSPDAAGFKRSSSQIAAGLQRAIARGKRNT